MGAQATAAERQRRIQTFERKSREPQWDRSQAPQLALRLRGYGAPALALLAPAASTRAAIITGIGRLNVNYVAYFS